MWRISGQGCGMDGILFISTEGLNNGATAAPGGSMADLLWGSGKPQSQTPEETAEEGGDYMAKGRGASCFLQSLITFIGEQPASPHGLHGTSAPPHHPGPQCRQTITYKVGGRRTGANDYTTGRMLTVVLI